MKKYVSANGVLACLRLGISSRELADLAGVSETFARAIRNGRRPFPKRILAKLNKHLIEAIKVEQEMFDQFADLGKRGDDKGSVIYIFVYQNIESLRVHSTFWKDKDTSFEFIVKTHLRIAGRVLERLSSLSQHNFRLVFWEDLL